MQGDALLSRLPGGIHRAQHHRILTLLVNVDLGQVNHELVRQVFSIAAGYVHAKLPNQVGLVDCLVERPVQVVPAHRNCQVCHLHPSFC